MIDGSSTITCKRSGSVLNKVDTAITCTIIQVVLLKVVWHRNRSVWWNFCVITVFWISSWYRGFCHRIESDLFFFPKMFLTSCRRTNRHIAGTDKKSAFCLCTSCILSADDVPIECLGHRLNTKINDWDGNTILKSDWITSVVQLIIY